MSWNVYLNKCKPNIKNGERFELEKRPYLQYIILEISYGIF